MRRRRLTTSSASSSAPPPEPSGPRAASSISLAARTLGTLVALSGRELLRRTRLERPRAFFWGAVYRAAIFRAGGGGGGGGGGAVCACRPRRIREASARGPGFLPPTGIAAASIRYDTPGTMSTGAAAGRGPARA